MSAFCLDITSLTREQAEQLSPEDKAAVIAWSDERDQELRRLLGTWREGHAAGRALGYSQGYADSETSHDSELDVTRRMLGEPVSAVVNPGPDAQRRVRAAEAAGKRDQAEHERSFVARAYATPAGQRSDVQTAVIYAYPPPGRRPGPVREYSRPAPVVPLRSR